ncbi:MAG: hypothetical protein QM710_14055 [Flavobacterium sp.]
MKNFYILAFLIAFQFSFAQVGIGTTNPSTSSALEISSTNSGLLIPRVALTSTTDTATIASPATSLMVYNTNTANDVTPGFYYWEGSWKKFGSGTTSTPSTGGWNLTGNTVTGTDYLGTNNYYPLIFKVNGNQFSRFHPNGGLAIGNGAAANDNNSVAIGTSATATTSNQAVAIGPSSNAAGYQSVAIGLNSATSNNNTVALGTSSNASGYLATAIGVSSASSNNNSFAIGNSANASGQQAMALGQEANSSGQNATAIGYQATTSQANAIVLGNSSNGNSKIGIGTNTPDEKLHVVGSIKMVDGNQANGYILMSDANGKASWKSPTTVNYGWTLTGNSALSTDFLGTTNAMPLVFKVSNNQFARFHQTGGFAIGNGAAANDNNAIAIGTSATATANNQAIAIGQSSTASGYQSMAIGLNTTANSNSAVAIGSAASATAQNATSLGLSASASGQNATAIGYQASTSQANAIVLGNASNTSNKVGIGTSTPDERLHVVGSIKIVDGTQANNYVLTSDANGKASWKAAAGSTVTKAYGELYRNANTNLSSGAINFGTTGVSSNVSISGGDTIQTTIAGTYRITYTISLRKNSGSVANAEFYLGIYGSEIAGTRSFITINNGETRTVSISKLVDLNAYQGILAYSSLTDSSISILANGASLSLELIK